MGLLVLEGFDNVGSIAQLALKGWVNGGTFTTVTGRSGTGQAWKNTNSATVATRSCTASSTIFLGIAFFQNLASTAADQIQLRAGATAAMGLRVNASNHIEIRNSGGTLIATGTASLLINTWYYIEVKLVINGASGSVTVNVNGAPDITVTTGNFGSSNIDNLGVIARNTTGLTLDDIYLFDSSGSVNNAFVGDVRVQTLYPTSDGAHLQWTPTGGGAHYTQVDELTPDDDTTYVSDSTPGDIDTYGFGDVDGGAVVHCVQTNMYARKDDGSTRQIAPVIRQSSTDHVGNTVTLSSAYSYYLQAYDNDGAGSAWTAAALNAAEIGVKEIA